MKKVLLVLALVAGMSAQAQEANNAGTTVKIEQNDNSKSQKTDLLGLGQVGNAAKEFIERRDQRRIEWTQNRLAKRRTKLLVDHKFSGKKMNRKLAKKVAGLNSKLGLEWDDYNPSSQGSYLDVDKVHLGEMHVNPNKKN